MVAGDDGSNASSKLPGSTGLDIYNRRTWDVDGYPIANASDIPITSKNSFDENDKYILSKIMDRNYVEYYNRGCK